MVSTAIKDAWSRLDHSTVWGRYSTQGHTLGYRFLGTGSGNHLQRWLKKERYGSFSLDQCVGTKFRNEENAPRFFPVAYNTLIIPVRRVWVKMSLKRFGQKSVHFLNFVPTPIANRVKLLVHDGVGVSKSEGIFRQISTTNNKIRTFKVSERSHSGR